MNCIWKSEPVLKGFILSLFSRGGNVHTTSSIFAPASRPPSSFGLFLQERKNANSPDMRATSGSFMRALAIEWKSLGFDVKQEYAERAQKAMAAYKASFNSLTTEEKLEVLNEKKQRSMTRLKRKEKKIKQSAGLPKRPLTPYSFFLKHLFSSGQVFTSKITSKDHVRNVKLKWEQLSLEDKEKFAEMSVQDKARYMTEMESYVKRLRKEGRDELIPKKYRNHWTD